MQVWGRLEAAWCKAKLTNDDVMLTGGPVCQTLQRICNSRAVEHLSNVQTHFGSVVVAPSPCRKPSRMLIDNFKVDSPNVQYESDAIAATYNYDHTDLSQGPDGKWIVRPTTTQYELRTSTRVPKLG